VTYVYFIASPDGSAVKIGVANEPRQRLSAMQVSVHDGQLSLLATMPGDERYEASLHERFASHRMQGEWFRRDGDLATFIEMVASIPAPSTARPRKRAKADLKAFTPDPEREAEFQSLVADYEAKVKEVVMRIGPAKFAEFYGVKTYMVVHAINKMNGRRFPAEWLTAFKHLASPSDHALVAKATMAMSRCEWP
jgi:hypothetical protein